MAGKQETKLNHCRWWSLRNISVTPWVWAVLVLWLCVSAAASPPDSPPHGRRHSSRNAHTIDSRLKSIDRALTAITKLHQQPKQCDDTPAKYVGYSLAGGLGVWTLSTWVDDLRMRGADLTQDLIVNMTQCAHMDDETKKAAMMVWYDMEIVQQLLHAAAPLQNNATLLSKRDRLQRHILKRCFRRKDHARVVSHLVKDPFYLLLKLKPMQQEARGPWAQCWQRAVIGKALKVIQRSRNNNKQPNHIASRFTMT